MLGNVFLPTSNFSNSDFPLNEKFLGAMRVWSIYTWPRPITSWISHHLPGAAAVTNTPSIWKAYNSRSSFPIPLPISCGLAPQGSPHPQIQGEDNLHLGLCCSQSRKKRMVAELWDGFQSSCAAVINITFSLLSLTKASNMGSLESIAWGRWACRGKGLESWEWNDARSSTCVHVTHGHTKQRTQNLSLFSLSSSFSLLMVWAVGEGMRREEPLSVRNLGIRGVRAHGSHGSW